MNTQILASLFGTVIEPFIESHTPPFVNKSSILKFWFSGILAFLGGMGASITSGQSLTMRDAALNTVITWSTAELKHQLPWTTSSAQK